MKFFNRSNGNGAHAETVTDQPVISIKDITKDYPMGEEILQVLRGLTLDIQRGEYRRRSAGEAGDAVC